MARRSHDPLRIGCAPLAFVLQIACVGAPDGAGAGLDASDAVESQADAGTVSPDAATEGPPCPERRYPAEAYTLPVGVLRTTLVDPLGAPVSGVSATVCGVDVCLSGGQVFEGRVAIDGGGAVLTNPAFKVGDGVRYAVFATPLTSGQTGWDEVTVVGLPQDGAPLVAATTVSSNGVALTVPADGRVVRPILVAAEAPFGAVVLPPRVPMPVVDPALGLELLVALGPTDTRLCPPAQLSVPNARGWPPGTAVELFLHGASALQKEAPYGGWRKVSVASVAPDGLTVRTDAAGGLPMLGLVGLRRAR